MPLVMLRANPTKVNYKILADICKAIPSVAADALSTDEGGKLTPDKIMVDVNGEFSHLAQNPKSLSVIIYAHDYAERRANLDERRKQIEAAIVELLEPGTSYYVWLWLGMTSYGSDTE